MERNFTMKPIIGISALAVMALATACSPTYQAGSSGGSDDVYYSAGDNAGSQGSPSNGNSSSGNSQNSQNPAGSNNNTNYDYNQDQTSGTPDYSNSAPQESYSTTSQSSDGSGNTYVTNNYYNTDDYYDYSYSARVKRFYDPVNGYGYYDPYYTNSYYYDYNPASWGVSIYLGYNWWAPSYAYYAPFSYGGFGISFGWGYPYYGYGYGGYPYYGYGYGYPYYGYGYGCGYPSYGYGGCYNPCYYNSYDHYNSGVYYGPRGSIASAGGETGPSRPPRSVGSSYEGAVIGGKIAASNPELPGRLTNATDGSMRKSEGTSKGAYDTRPAGLSNDSKSDYYSTPANGTRKTETGKGVNTNTKGSKSSTSGDTRPDTRGNEPAGKSESPSTRPSQGGSRENRATPSSPSRESQPTSRPPSSKPRSDRREYQPSQPNQNQRVQRNENGQADQNRYLSDRRQPNSNSYQSNNNQTDQNRYQRARENAQSRPRQESSSVQRSSGGERQQPHNAQPSGRSSSPSVSPSHSSPSRGSSVSPGRSGGGGSSSPRGGGGGGGSSSPRGGGGGGSRR